MRRVFLWREQADGSTELTQVTTWPPGPHPEFLGGASDVAISRDGWRLAHARLQPGPPATPGGSIGEIWISDCATPAPPFDGWLRSPDLPGFGPGG